MVFFTCNSCGQSVKKNQVEKHRIQCRKCQSLSCMDCGKDFWGEAYVQHTKCMTEEEKYSGKDYKEKASALKRVKLQEQLSDHLQTVVAERKSNDKLTELLRRLIPMENIPHKHLKFQKYLENSLKISDMQLINDAWKIFSDALLSFQSNEEKKSKESEGNVKTLDDSSVMEEKQDVSQASTDEKKKKHKKKRKHDDKEMDNSQVSNGLEEAADETNKTCVTTNDDNSEKTNSPKKKKRKSHNEGEIDTCNVSNGLEEAVDETDKMRAVTNDDKSEKTNSHKKKKRKSHNDEAMGNSEVSNKSEAGADEMNITNTMTNVDKSENTNTHKKKKRKSHDKEEMDNSEISSRLEEPADGMNKTPLTNDDKLEHTNSHKKKKRKSHTEEEMDNSQISSGLEAAEESNKMHTMTIDDKSENTNSHKKKKRKSHNKEEMDNGEVSSRLEEHADGMTNDDKLEHTNSHKKKKKHSHSPDVDETKSMNAANGNALQETAGKNDGSSKKKNKKLGDFQHGDTCITKENELNQNLENVDENESTGEGKKKFKWTKAIKEVLSETAEHKLRLKHLRKKVLKQYKAIYGPEAMTEHLKEKFNQKCQSNFKLENDYVLLENNS